MRKYYLFIIKQDIYNKYKNKSYILYKILENLYNLNSYNFSYGIKIYNQICSPFAVKVLKNYINEKIVFFKVNEKVIKINSIYEDTYLNIKYSCVIIKTNANIPNILKIFNIYNKYILICDFKNKDYFWLNNIIKTTFIKKNI